MREPENVPAPLLQHVDIQILRPQQIDPLFKRLLLAFGDLVDVLRPLDIVLQFEIGKQPPISLDQVVAEIGNSKDADNRPKSCFCALFYLMADGHGLSESNTRDQVNRKLTLRGK